MHLLNLIITVIAILGNLCLGLLTYLKMPKSHTNRLFFVFSIVIASYIATNYLALSSLEIGTPATTLLYVRSIIFIAFLINLVFFLFAKVYPGNNFKWNSMDVIGAIIITAILSPISYTNLIYLDIQMTLNGSSSIPGSGMPIFIAHTLILIGLGSAILVKKYLHFKGVQKQQVKFLLIGALVMLTLILFTNLLVVLVFDSTNFVGLLPLYTLLFVGSISYAIVKHRFLDIRFIIVRSLAFLLLMLFIALGYIAILFNIAFFFNNQQPSLQTLEGLILPSLLALFFAVTFQPLRKVFEKMTNKIFYRDQYDSNELLWSMSRIMASTLLLEELTGQILEKLLSAMKLNYGSIVLIKDKTLSWVMSEGDVSHHAFKHKDIYTLVFDSYHMTRQDEHVYIFEELPEGKVKKLMRDQDLTIVLPLTVRNELVGGLLLGQKSSGEIYSTEDIDVLKIVAPEIAVAVKNALAYDEIKKFNVTLENEVHRATSRLRHANIRLKELDQLKDEFVSIASHELRTPMTAIKSYLWMALNQPNQKIKEPLKKYLNISYNSTERLITLVNDMLTVSRIERNKIELKKEPINMIDVVNLVFEELKITADEKGIHFTFDHPKTGLMVNGDKEKLREVIQNIVGNALKFTPEKGSIQIVAQVKGKNMHVGVTDTASGIPKESIHKLFQKFSKIEYSYSKHSSQPGTGLGLYISKKIASLHGGDIEVESEVGVGSTFTVILPLYTKSKGGDKAKHE